MPLMDLGEAVRLAQSGDPSSVADVVLRLAGEIGATDVVIYLADFGQNTLEPLPDLGAHVDVPRTEEVATTMAGRAFVDQVPIVAERPEGARVWVPIIEGSDRTGVLAATVPAAPEPVVTALLELGLFAGYLIATHARSTDLYNLRRRRRALSLAASMQWDLLPPLVLKTGRLVVAGLVEPAYDVGGDCFDYALNGNTFNLALFDPMGHGVRSALIAALCVGAYRHDRREGQTLVQMHAHLESTLAEVYAQAAFATGQLARIDLDRGEMSWTNAGHPLPMLIRNGTVIGPMECSPTLPWGLGSLAPPVTATVSTAALEPGDSVLFYTDGVTDAHLAGETPFGAERLADLAQQHASDQVEPEEIVRRLVQAVLEHQADSLADDATLLLLQWTGPGTGP